MTVAFRFAILSLTLTLLAPSVARAQTEPCPDSSVQSLIEQGYRLRQNHRDEEALTTFLCALERERSAEVLAQVALAEQALGRWSSSAQHLESVLSMNDPFVEEYRAVLTESLATVERHLTTAQRPAPGAPTRDFEETQTAIAEPAPIPDADTATTSRAPASGDPSAMMIGGSIAAGVGVAAVIVGMGLLIERWRIAEESQACREAGDSGCIEALSSGHAVTEASGAVFLTVGASVAVIGGALILVESTLIFVDLFGDSARDDTAARCTPTLLGVACVGRF